MGPTHSHSAASGRYNSDSDLLRVYSMYCNKVLYTQLLQNYTIYTITQFTQYTITVPRVLFVLRAIHIL